MEIINGIRTDPGPKINGNSIFNRKDRHGKEPIRPIPVRPLGEGVIERAAIPLVGPPVIERPPGLPEEPTFRTVVKIPEVPKVEPGLIKIDNLVIDPSKIKRGAKKGTYTVDDLKRFLTVMGVTKLSGKKKDELIDLLVIELKKKVPGVIVEP